MKVVSLGTRHKAAKRSFDIALSAVGLALLWWLILIGWVIAAIDTRQNGLFTQARIGKDGRLFNIWKLRTMREDPDYTTTVTTSSDPRITRSGVLLRRSKWNELPQLWNVLVGHMSFVGPRPEVPGFADKLEGPDQIILTVRPGITGPATLRFRNEEVVLDSVTDPDSYNLEQLYPIKVKLNREYVENYRFLNDVNYVVLTLLALLKLPLIQNWIDRMTRTEAPVEPLREPIVSPEPEMARFAESA